MMKKNRKKEETNSFTYRNLSLQKANSRRYSIACESDISRLTGRQKSISRLSLRLDKSKMDIVDESLDVAVSVKLRKFPFTCAYCLETDSNLIHYKEPLLNAKTEKEIIQAIQPFRKPGDEKPALELDKFRVYDEARHLCPFDGNLLQDNVSLFFSGYVKSADDENEDDSSDEYPAEDLGPITEWWVAGYDSGEKAIVGISSDSGDYYLNLPHEEYAPLMKILFEKIACTKILIDILQDASKLHEVDYDVMINKLQITVPPPGMRNFTEEFLHKHATFIVDQIVSFDSTADAEDFLLCFAPCIRQLSDKLHIDLEEREIKMRKKRGRNCVWSNKRPLVKYSMAATTRLVENVFENFFHGQMKKSSKVDKFSIRSCTVLLTRLEDQGEKWLRYLKQECNERRSFTPMLPEKEVTRHVKGVKLTRLSDEQIDFYINQNKKHKSALSDEYSESESEPEYVPRAKKRCLKGDDSSFSSEDEMPIDCFKRKKRKRSYQTDVQWYGESFKEVDGFNYYKAAIVSGNKISVGDFVSTLISNSVARIKYLWENDDGEKLFHAHWFMRSVDTILGEVGNPSELFVSDGCQNVMLNEVIEVVHVTFLPMLSNWNLVGNSMLTEWNMHKRKSSNNEFFFQKRYNEKLARFEDLEDESTGLLVDCFNCEKQRQIVQREIPYSEEKSIYDREMSMFALKMVRWRDEEYCIGSCVFLTPGTIMKLAPRGKENVEIEETFDERMYPEKYRKYLHTKANKQQDDETLSDPFEIGYICEIWSKRQEINRRADVKLKLKKFYRPHNTPLDQSVINGLDLNLLYWSDEDCFVDFSKVEGKCYVAYERNIRCSIDEWTSRGPYRFYFRETYNKMLKIFEDPPLFATKIGKIAENFSYVNDVEKPPDYPSVSRPLRSMDVFAGCGGLSEGLHQAKVAECLWAIEKDAAAAHAFRLNNPNATVFTDDCNDLLNLIINNETEKRGQLFPKKGDVELLCGGPPCQGFSGMNRFNNGQHSQFNNSLIVSYLSFCDYYRPRFFILENVRNFVSHSKSTVLKLTLNCLVKMGYQVTFGVLQCGRFGIPQSRRRAIILAAAPGEILPQFPESTHTFKQSKYIDVTVDEKKYGTNCVWSTSAPYRMITVYDALSDLPPIKEGDSKENKSYAQKPLTHFQRELRTLNGKEETVLKDHITKQLSALVVKRLSYIPRKPGCDWRDLPNICVELDDGSYTNQLEYTHHDVRNGRSSTGALRGVCCCASNMKCRSEFRQSDTLIPWCLPHTGNRHNNWSGLYGRLSWDDYFRTVVTNPEPMGKQGRVVHPEEDRVISVRECARSQGFPDRFRFFGSILDKHRQIGNAVAPPLAKSIGIEIKKCVNAVESKVHASVK